MLLSKISKASTRQLDIHKINCNPRCHLRKYPKIVSGEDTIRQSFSSEFHTDGPATEKVKMLKSIEAIITAINNNHTNHNLFYKAHHMVLMVVTSEALGARSFRFSDM